MMTQGDCSALLRDQVAAALADRRRLRIRGGDSRAFYGRPVSGEVLDLSGHSGILDYEPSELVITARAGTSLAELEAVLAARGQMLAFEPPAFSAASTIGGAIACAMSGPRRPYAGAARDFVLGVRCINGQAQVLGFGGRVMKNVAGYDVSRLMCGALGTLGVLLDVSLKVLPRAPCELTLAQPCSEAQAIERCNRWAGTSLPISASSFAAGILRVRLSGSDAAVDQAAAALGGERIADGDGWWRQLRDQTLPWFAEPGRLWRLSLPPAAPALELPGEQFIEWGGALRWLRWDGDAAQLRTRVAALGGHATLYRGARADEEVFHPLPPALLEWHRSIRNAFDPQRLFNAGRLYREV